MTTLATLRIDVERACESYPLATTIPLPLGWCRGQPVIRLAECVVEGGAGATETALVEVEPFGDRAADGSYPFAFVRGALRLPAGEGVRASLERATVAIPGGFQVHPLLASWLTLSNPFRLQLNGEEVRFELAPDECRETVLTRTYLLVARLGRLVGRLRCVVTSGCPLVRFDFGCIVDGYGASEGWTGGVQQITGDLALVVDRAQVQVDGEAQAVLGVGTDEHATRILLMDEKAAGMGQGAWSQDPQDYPQIVDGQGPTAITGLILPHETFDGVLRPLPGAVTAIAVEWPASKSYGAFGVVPRLPPWADVQDGRSHFQPSLPDRCPFGHGYYPAGDMMLPDGSMPGDQKPIRVVPFTEAIHKARPDRLGYSLACLLRENCRPNTYLDRDGSLFRADKHPGTWFWSGRPWARDAGNVCPDPLGRPLGDIDMGLSPFAQVAIHWSNWDLEHWLTVYHAFTALLTGHPWAMERLEYVAELAIASRPTDSGNPSFDGTQAARAEGRWMREMAHAIKIVPSDELRSRLRTCLRARAKLVQAAWEKQWGSVRQPLSSTVARWFDPMPSFGDYNNVNHATDRIQHANPWQEGILSEGVYAAGLALQDEDLLMLGDHLAWTVVKFGCELRGVVTGTAQIAIGIRASASNEGHAVIPEAAVVASEESYLDGEGKPARRCVGDVDWGDGTAYLSWSMGGLLYFQSRTAKIDALYDAHARTTEVCKRAVATLQPSGDVGDPQENTSEQFGSVANPYELPMPPGVVITPAEPAEVAPLPRPT